MNVVAHNISAMNASRQLNITDKSKAKASEKLCSGFKINRAADDAAGLTISETMRKQVRGLNRASDNIQEGISLLQIADGALNETHAILQRMRELSVHSANGTNSTSDRQAMQDEINLLLEEVDRIATTTNFNNQVYPLNDTPTVDSVAPTGPIGFTMRSVKLKEETYQIINNSTVMPDQVMNGQPWPYGTTTTVTGLSITTPSGTQHALDLQFNVSFDWSRYPNHIVDDYADTYLSGNYNLKLSDLKTDDNGYIYYESKEYPGPKYYFRQVPTGGVGPTTTLDPSQFSYMVKNPDPSEEYISYQNVWLQSGTETMEGMIIGMANATIEGLGIKDLSIMTQDEATDALDSLDYAIARTSYYRSRFGAQQNRLEHAIKITDNTAENTQSAESKIRDTDMAEEMIRFSKENILQQAGQAVLAQANQSTQGVLSLLQQ